MSDALCVYCCSGEPRLTKDHVPPKCLFPKPRPKLITVPCCHSCNDSFKKDDEYFRLAVCAEAAYFNSEATRLWKERVLWRVGPGLRATVLSRIQICNLRTAGGLFVGRMARIPFDSKRICRVVQRIALGLQWYHYQERPHPDSEIEVFIKPDLSQASELLTAMILCNIGDTAFRYRHGRPHDARDCSVWGMQFYERAHFLVTIVGPLSAGRREVTPDPTPTT